ISARRGRTDGTGGKYKYRRRCLQFGSVYSESGRSAVKVSDEPTGKLFNARTQIAVIWERPAATSSSFLSRTERLLAIQTNKTPSLKQLRCNQIVLKVREKVGKVTLVSALANHAAPATQERAAPPRQQLSSYDPPTWRE